MKPSMINVQKKIYISINMSICMHAPSITKYVAPYISESHILEYIYVC